MNNNEWIKVSHDMGEKDILSLPGERVYVWFIKTDDLTFQNPIIPRYGHFDYVTKNDKVNALWKELHRVHTNADFDEFQKYWNDTFIPSLTKYEEYDVKVPMFVDYATHEGTYYRDVVCYKLAEAIPEAPDFLYADDEIFDVTERG